MRFIRHLTQGLDRRLIANIGWLGSANVVVKPIWFVFVTAVCMRILGAESYGVFSTALALGTVTASVSDFGTTRLLIRDLARDRSRSVTVLSSLFALRFGLTFAGFLLAIVVGYALGYGRGLMLSLIFASLYALALSMTSFFRGVFQGLEVLKHEAKSLYIEKGLVIVIATILLVRTREPHWVLGGMAAGMWLTLLYLSLVVRKRFVRFVADSIDVSFLRTQIGVLIPIGLASLFTLLYMKVDMVMIERMLGDRSAGHYGAAYRILEAMSMLPHIVAFAAVYPRLSSLHSDLARMKSLLRSSAVILTVIAIGVSTVLALGAPLLISLLAPGGDFTAASPVLQVLVWTYPFVCANAILYSGLLALNQERVAVFALMAVFIFNAGTNYIIIPVYGVIGSAATTVITEILLMFAYIVRLAIVVGNGSGPELSVESVGA